jgi:Tol biopolymer transport system component
MLPLPFVPSFCEKTVSLFRIDVSDKVEKRLTMPANNWIGDSNQSLSADGNKLAFTRTNLANFDKLMVLDLNTNDLQEFKQP